MTRLSQLVEISRAVKAAYDSSTCPAERKRLEQIGSDVARLIGRAVTGKRDESEVGS